MGIGDVPLMNLAPFVRVITVELQPAAGWRFGVYCEHCTTGTEDGGESPVICNERGEDPLIKVISGCICALLVSPLSLKKE